MTQKTKLAGCADMWECFSQIPCWDFGLSFSNALLREFDFGENGLWTYCIELPSIWHLSDDDSGEAGKSALALLSAKRRSEHQAFRLPLDTITIANTLSCNLACTYCYNYNAMGQNAHPTKSAISPQVIGLAIGTLFERSNPGAPLTILFIGGEPLLRWDLLREAIDDAMARAASERRHVRFGINTNSTLITKEKLDWINVRPIFLFLSYDGPSHLHNMNRPTVGGEPSFKLVQRGIELYVRRYAKKIKSCRMTLNILHEPHRFSDLIVDALQRGFNDVSIGLNAKAAADQPDVIKALINDLSQVENICEDAYSDGSLLRFSWFNEVWSVVANGAVRYRPCKAGDGYLATDPTGNLYACQRYIGSKSDILGHLTDPVLPQFPVRFVENTENSDCDSCWARRICGGECHSVLDEIGRSNLLKKQTLCVMRRAIFESALRVYVRLKMRRSALLDDLIKLSKSEFIQESSNL